MFDTGDRVLTTMGVGSIVYRRLAPPDYARADAYSVKLDGREHVGAILPADKVRALVKSKPDLVLSTGRVIEHFEGFTPNATVANAADLLPLSLEEWQEYARLVIEQKRALRRQGGVA